MRDTIGSFVVEDFNKMKARRSNWEAHWQEIAERILPDHARFNVQNLWGGGKNTRKIYDGTSAFALTRHSAIMESLLTPHTQVWHHLRCPFPEINERDDVHEYFERVNKILFTMRYAPDAGFISATQEYYLSIGAFGTSPIFLSSVLKNGKPSFNYINVPLNEFFFRAGWDNRPIACVRAFERTAPSLIREFGNASDELVKAAEKEPDRRFLVLHYVCPNGEMPIKAKEPFEYVSAYVLHETGQTLQVGGYYTFPYIVGRYMTAPSEEYGRSPAMLVLPDIKMLDEMSRTTIRAAHRAVEPPLLTVEDGALSRLNLVPNAINAGGLDEAGNPLVRPFEFGSNFTIGLELQDQRRAMINDAFFITLFQILVETPRMTATEVIQRAQEKSSLLSPIMGRQQSELLGRMIDREIDILERAELLPPMPEALEEAGGVMAIEYDSPLTRLQQSEEVGGIMRTLESALPLMQLDPQIADNFDFDAMTRLLARGNGAPSSVMRRVEEIQAMREQRAQEQEQERNAMMMETASNAVKNTAQAQKFQAEAMSV